MRRMVVELLEEGLCPWSFLNKYGGLWEAGPAEEGQARSWRAGREAVIMTKGVSIEAQRRMRRLAVRKFEFVRVEISMAVVTDAAQALWGVSLLCLHRGCSDGNEGFQPR